MSGRGAKGERKGQRRKGRKESHDCKRGRERGVKGRVEANNEREKLKRVKWEKDKKSSEGQAVEGRERKQHEVPKR